MSLTRRSKRLQDRRNRQNCAATNADMVAAKKTSRQNSAHSTADDSDWEMRKKVPRASSRQTRYCTRRRARRVSISPPARRRSASGPQSTNQSVEEHDQYKNLYERVKKRVRRVPRDCYHMSRYEEVQRQNRYNPFSSILRGKRTSNTHTRRRRRSRGCLSWMSTSSSSSESSNEVEKDDVFTAEASPKRPQSRSQSNRTAKCANKDAAPSLFNGERMIRTDFEAVKLDKRITFESVGGHERSIRVLKEMIIFPLMYDEVFSKFKIRPPRGVLFHGPPGTGKTLLARALANECSSGTRKVSFFMRKGADCLSKWVGESERQLKNLFEKAYTMRPSIIFFDEIDGLAPVRSSRQDQIHTSIVSTLLALMDGVDSDSGIVVIGATNRLDFIDPALRRPGRFDREFYFGLPKLKVRADIIRIHTKDWQVQLTEEQVSNLAERTNGFCGADLQALCRDSVLHALRRTYPQVYRTKKRLNLNPDAIRVMDEDFEAVLSTMGSSAARTSSMYAMPLPNDLKCLLRQQTESIFNAIVARYPAFLEGGRDGNNLPKGHVNMTTFKPRLLLAGLPSSGVSTYIAPSILHMLETNVYAIDPLTLFSPAWRSVEEAITNQFRLASQNVPSVIYIPRVDSWWSYLSESAQMMTLNAVQCLDPRAAVLLAVTVDCKFEDAPQAVQGLFDKVLHVFPISGPRDEERAEFFRKIFENDVFNALSFPACPKDNSDLSVTEDSAASDEETLLERPMDAAELEALWEREEAVMTSLRLFLREMLSRFVHDKRFTVFRGPVDPAHVSDYYDIIKQPIDLSMIMCKIDKHNYFTVDHFLDDMKLLLRNANMYNPDAVIDDRDLRHKASHLYDFVMSTVKNELHTDSHEEVKQIFRDRLTRGAIRQIPIRYVMYRSVYPEDVHQSPSNSLSAYASQVFIRYQPVIGTDSSGRPLIELREDDCNSHQGEPDDDHPRYRRILAIEPEESETSFYFECVPRSGQQMNGSHGLTNGHVKASPTPRSKVSSSNRRRDSSVGASSLKSLKKKLTEMTQRSTAASNEWPLEKLQKYKSRIYSAVSRFSHKPDQIDSILQAVEAIVTEFCGRRGSIDPARDSAMP